MVRRSGLFSETGLCPKSILVYEAPAQKRF